VISSGARTAEVTSTLRPYVLKNAIDFRTVAKATLVGETIGN